MSRWWIPVLMLSGCDTDAFLADHILTLLVDVDASEALYATNCSACTGTTDQAGTARRTAWT